jgi:hypothetical protein
MRVNIFIALFYFYRGGGRKKMPENLEAGGEF